MATRTTGFFAGMATTFFILAIGFAGGLLIAKTAMQPAPPTSTRGSDRLAPARVVLPAPAEAAERPLATAAVRVSAAPVSQPGNDVQQSAEEQKDIQAERAERRKAETLERERRKRVAERKAKREAAHKARQQLEVQQQAQQPGVMAFGSDNEQSRMGGLFAN